MANKIGPLIKVTSSARCLTAQRTPSVRNKKTIQNLPAIRLDGGHCF